MWWVSGLTGSTLCPTTLLMEVRQSLLTSLNIIKHCTALNGVSLSELRCSGPDWYEFGEFCYKPFEEKKTWHGARTACRQLGADLASIISMTEQSWLESYLYLGTCVYWLVWVQINTSYDWNRSWILFSLLFWLASCVTCSKYWEACNKIHKCSQETHFNIQ